MKPPLSFSKNLLCFTFFLGLLFFGAVNALQAQEGIIKSHQKINSAYGNFTGILEYRDLFGGAVAPLGDLDKDGVMDLVVGARRDDDGDKDAGAIWILFMKPDGMVKSHQKISAEEGNLNNHSRAIASGTAFGHAVAALGDINGDGVIDLAVSAHVNGKGYIFILFLELDGTVKGVQEIGPSGQGNFKGKIDDRDQFGFSLAPLGDLNHDGVPDLVVGTLEMMLVMFKM